MQPEEATLPDFGEPLDPDELLAFATIDASDMESAVLWFDENATDTWIGSLEAPPYTP